MNKFVKLNPHDAVSYFNLGNTEKELGRLEEAEASYKKAITIKADFTEAYSNLGLVQKEQGKLEEAIATFRQAIISKPDYAVAYFNLANIEHELSRLGEAEAGYNKAIELKPDYVEAYFNLGNILKNIGRLNEAEVSYKKAITIKPDYAVAHCNLGITLQLLGRLNEAEVCYKKAITIKADFTEAYNNLGNILHKKGKLDDAIEKYSQALTLDPEILVAKTNIISILECIVPHKKNTNPIIVASRNLQKINRHYKLENLMKKNELANFFKKCNKVVQDSYKEITTIQTQIYRRNSINLGCNRHKQIFAESNIIAKACFSCFKVQVEPKNVLELFKLFFIFDKIVLPKNNSRKCMVELRSFISGTYKGIIFCSSIKETNEIIEIISPIINKLTQCKIKIKRGCSEYGFSFPEYEETNRNNPNFMKYKDKWQEIEKNFDIKKNIKLINQNSTLSGISVSDILIMNNWLNYAKNINDQSYKSISEEIVYSEYPYQKLTEQLVKRKENFLSQLDLIY